MHHVSLSLLLGSLLVGCEGADFSAQLHDNVRNGTGFGAGLRSLDLELPYRGAAAEKIATGPASVKRAIAHTTASQCCYSHSICR